MTQGIVILYRSSLKYFCSFVWISVVICNVICLWIYVPYKL